MSKSGVVGLLHVAMVIHQGGGLLGALEGAAESAVLCHQVLDLSPQMFTHHLVVGVLVVRVIGVAGQEAKVDDLLNAVAVLQRVDESYLLLCGLFVWELGGGKAMR